ncbi:MAG: agmatinase [Bacteroidetes bacterium]|nr:MAG: agmatinase [Bacteroidota bacterium]
MIVLDSSENFLGITEKELFQYNTSRCVIQQLPYEHTSSYKQGSYKGPSAVIQNSQYVEFYDPEIDDEAYKKCGISSIPPLDFKGKVNAEAMETVYLNSKNHLANDKFLVTIGGEHTVSYGLFKAFQEKWSDIGILQLDAHSDLRDTYEGNKWSHASVMARINELNPEIFQVGIRAQCIEESQLIKSSSNIHCWYAHQLWETDTWIDEVVSKLPKNLYITIDTDGFDPSICPSVGTPEPGGLQWYSTLKLLRKVFEKCDVKGFDIVELNPLSNEDLTAYTMAQLCYKLIGYKYCL